MREHQKTDVHFYYSLKSCCLMRASEDRRVHFYYSLKNYLMREHQKTEVYFLLQSEELLSDERASEDRSLFLLQSEEV